jgi:hypothetical protein
MDDNSSLLVQFCHTQLLVSAHGPQQQPAMEQTNFSFAADCSSKTKDVGHQCRISKFRASSAAGLESSLRKLREAPAVSVGERPDHGHPRVGFKLHRRAASSWDELSGQFVIADH